MYVLCDLLELELVITSETVCILSIIWSYLAPPTLNTTLHIFTLIYLLLTVYY